MAEKAEPKIYTGDDLYKLTPKDAPDSVIINCGTSTVMVPADADSTSTVRLLPGDRLDTPKYVDKVIGKVPGLARLNKLALPHAKKLEHIQRVRAGVELDDYTKEARANKGKESNASALSGDSDLEAAIRAGRAENKR